MKQLPGIILRSLLIMFLGAAIGLGVNAVRTTGLPWVYVPPEELLIGGVKVRLVDEKEAVRFLDDPETVFVDSRREEDYRERHVKSAVFSARGECRGTVYHSAGLDAGGEPHHFVLLRARMRYGGKGSRVPGPKRI